MSEQITPTPIEKKFDSLNLLVQSIARVVLNFHRQGFQQKLVWLAAIIFVIGNEIVLKHALGVIDKIFDRHLVESFPVHYSYWFWGSIGLLLLASVVLLVIKEYKSQGFRKIPLAKEDSPIIGLFSFDFKDAAIFKDLQRNDDIRQLGNALTSERFHWGQLSGVSGSGKTSFLRAGIYDWLKEKGIPCVVVTLTNAELMATIRHDVESQLKIGFPVRGSLSTRMAEVLRATEKPTLILIFDQFEQFFTQMPKAEDRGGYLHELKKLYLEQPAIKVLLSIRSDFEYKLVEIHGTFKYYLSYGENYFQLPKFKPYQVKEIYKVMAEKEGITDFDGDFVEEMAKTELANKEDGLVSAVDVQVIPWIMKREEAERFGFTSQHFQKMGGVDGLLQRFLEKILQPKNTFNANNEALYTLLALIDTERNVRAGRLSLEELKNKLGDLVPPTHLPDLLLWLEGNRLVYNTTPKEGTGKSVEEPYYELAHERLIEPIRRLEAGMEINAVKASALLANRCNEWEGSNRKRKYLLGVGEYFSIRKFRKVLAWGKSRATKEEFLGKSLSRLRLWAGCIALPLVLGLVWLGYIQTEHYIFHWGIQNKTAEIFKNLSDEDKKEELIDSLAFTDQVLAFKLCYTQQGYFKNRCISTTIGSWLMKDTNNLLAVQIAMGHLSNIEHDATLSRTIQSIAFSCGKLKEEEESLSILDSLGKILESRCNQKYYSTADALLSIADASSKLKDGKKGSELVDRLFNMQLELRDGELALIAGKLKDSEKGGQILDKLLARNRVESNFYSYLAEAASQLKDVEKGCQLLDKLLFLYEKTFNERTSDFYSSIALAAGRLKDVKKGGQLLERLLAMNPKGFHPEPLQVYTSIARAAGNLQNVEKGTKVLESLLNINLERLQGNFVDISDFYISIAEAASHLKDFEKGGQLLEKLLNINPEQLGKYSLSVYSTVANAACQLHDVERGGQLLDKLLAMSANGIEVDFNSIAEGAGLLQDVKKGGQLLDTILAMSINPSSQISIDYPYLAIAAGRLKDVKKGSLLLIKLFDTQYKKLMFNSNYYLIIAKATKQLNDKKTSAILLKSMLESRSQFENKNEIVTYQSALSLLYCQVGDFKSAYRTTTHVDTHIHLEEGLSLIRIWQAWKDAEKEKLESKEN